MRFVYQSLFFALLFSLTYASFQLHARMQLTFLGYAIGQLKLEEADLLKQRSILKMEAARLSQKEALLRRIAQGVHAAGESFR
ncbi:MAG: hypothetical protein OXT67_03150 [Zetaproteobacteria bacterium]|nr:hypothetical protein [Zetaproteobacteria bacterium]